MSRRHRRSRSRRRVLSVLVILIAVSAAAAFGVRALLRSDPQEETARLSRSANAALEAEKYDEARILLARLIERVPGNLAVRRQYLACLMKMKRFPDAAAAAREVLAISPDQAPAHAVLSLLHRRAGDLEAAIREARLAVRGKRVAPDARYVLADLLLDAGRRTEGLSQLARAVDAGSGGTDAAIRLAALTSRGAKADPVANRARRTLRRALDAAREERKRSPDSEEALLGYVRLALLAGNASVAAAELVGVKAQRELGPEERLLLARALGRLGETERAGAILDELGVDRGESISRVDLALAWLDAGAEDRAILVVDHALEETPGSPALLRIRVEALARIVGSDPERGPEVATRLLEAADTLLSSRPDDETARRARALALLTLGRLDEALEAASELRESGDTSPGTLWLKGLCLARLGKAEGAIPCLEEGRSAARDPEEAARWIARAAVQAGDGMRARREARRLEAKEYVALRAAAEATARHYSEAERLLEADGFASAPVRDRISAAVAFARGGRSLAAKSILAGIETAKLDDWSRLRIGDVWQILAETGSARTVYEEAARGEGPVAVAALMRLGKAALSGEEIDRDRLLDVRERLGRLERGRAKVRILDALLAIREKDAEGALEASADALRMRPDDRDALGTRLAALRLAGAEPEEADAVADRLLAIDPGHPGARLHRARRRFREGLSSLVGGESQQAEESFSEVVDALPDADVARLFRGLALARQGKLDRAEEDARLLIASPEDSAHGHVLMGLLELRRGRPEKAVESIELALARSPESGTALAAFALALAAAGRGDDALAAADRLDGVEKGSLRALFVRVRVLARSGKRDQALRLLSEREKEEDPAVNGVRMLRARVLRAAGRPADAAAVIRRVIEAEPDAVRPRLALVKVLAVAKLYDQALAACDEITAKGASRTVGLLARSIVNRLRGDAEAEVADLRRVLNRDPDDIYALTRLGKLRLADGNVAGGRSLLEHAAASEKGAVAARMRLAILAEEEGRDEEACELYDEVLSVRPDESLAANNLSWHLTRGGKDLPRAVELARTAVDARPENAEFRDTLALALSAAGLHRDAAQAAREAMKLDPESAGIALSASRILRAAGRLAEAKEAAERAETLK